MADGIKMGFGQASRGQRSALIVLLILAVAIAGAWYASRTRLAPQGVEITSVPVGALIEHIAVGALARPEEAQKPNPKFEQKQAYTTNDRLVMRITTTAAMKESFEIGVRLLTPAGKVVQMDPSSAAFTPGTSSFCCWTIAKEGTYTLQIFRPEKTISTIPLLIQKGMGPAQGAPNYNSIQLF
ncbi:MAG: hypothetical protein HYZ63_02090 [Candidatus Andersenbacteria bacterium]|nr:hypothetical protein [Candidatus Andersenbacteria bacterium]